MIHRTTLAAAAIACSLAILMPSFATEPLDLEHNPFARPPSEHIGPEVSPYTSLDGSVRVLDLRATMVGTHDKLAHVGGRVLRAGDEIQGYTLLRVYEDRAVFARQGKQEIIYVKPDPVEDDE